VIFSNFFKTKTGKLGCLYRAVRRRTDHFQCCSQTQPVCRRCGQCHGSGHQCHGQAPGGAVRHAANAGLLSAAAQAGANDVAVFVAVCFSETLSVAGGPANPAPTLSPISLFGDSSAGIPPAKKLSAVFAPFGRLIPCETVITVDSAPSKHPSSASSLRTYIMVANWLSRQARRFMGRPKPTINVNASPAATLDVDLAERDGNADQGHRP